MTRFVDASVFLHAYLKPRRREIPPDVQVLKRRAQGIVRRIAGKGEGEGEGEEEGEHVLTSVAHISEIANILEARAGLAAMIEIVSGLFSLQNLQIVDLSRDLYESSLERSRAFNLGLNDSLAWEIMIREGINEIYSFDSDFDNFKDLKRVAD